jgi:hypothetical protein
MTTRSGYFFFIYYLLLLFRVNIMPNSQALA